MGGAWGSERFSDGVRGGVSDGGVSDGVLVRGALGCPNCFTCEVWLTSVCVKGAGGP